MNDLVIKQIEKSLPAVKPEYGLMLKNIQNNMPAVVRDTSNFHKSHSQFMQVTLDITAISPIRSIKHTLAEIEQTRLALQEAYFKLRKEHIQLEIKTQDLKKETDHLKAELIRVEIMEIKVNHENSQNYVNGALRKMNFLVNQHQQLLKKIGRTEITEEDYEQEEAKYHIMTCMKQALNAARARGGLIDEGNHIYLFDLGINGAQAQAEVTAYLEMEKKIIASGNMPPHDLTVRWLEACANAWQKHPAKYAESRGFSVLDRSSLTNALVDGRAA
jgi:hypothetical protein